MPATDQRVRNILAQASLDGLHLSITEHLDRAEYTAVNRCLNNLGGTWSRHYKAHVFVSDPAELIVEVINGGDIPGAPRSVEGFVRTPHDLADQLVHDHLYDTEDDPLILEPSAGDGALVAAILRHLPKAKITALEPNGRRAHEMAGMDCAVSTPTFERFVEDNPSQHGIYDAVVMNPPFATIHNPTLWIDHVWLAWRALQPGGKLITIAPMGLDFRQDRKHQAMRDLFAEHGGWQALPEDAFTNSGTNVRTVAAWAAKGAEESPPPSEVVSALQPPKKRRGKLSEAGKAEYREQRKQRDAELREAANEAMEDSDYIENMMLRLQRLDTECRLAGYSQRNQVLVYQQADEQGFEPTGHMATFGGWKKRGRRVARGYRQLRITVNLGTVTEQSDQDIPETDDESDQRPRFRMDGVFDYAQTVPIENTQGA